MNQRALQNDSVVWVIALSENYRRNEPLYWSDALGWVGFDDCDKHKAVPEGYALPMQGNWAVSTIPKES
jgi:hypothetical protein